MAFFVSGETKLYNSKE